MSTLPDLGFIFLRFFFFFSMWTIFKLFIKSATIVKIFLFYFSAVLGLRYGLWA